MNFTSESQSGFSTTDLTGVTPFVENLAWSVTQTAIITLVSILIIFSNVTNILVISRSISGFGITGYFLISLAFADLGE